MSAIKLWQIPEAIETASELMINPETGECLNDEDVKKVIDSLNMERDRKVEFISKEIINLKKESELLKEQAKSFSERAKTAERKAERMKEYLKFALNGEKWVADDASVKISYRTTKNAVKVFDLDDIPDKYFKTPRYESNLNKTQLRDDLLNGEQLMGVKLEDRTSIIIK